LNSVFGTASLALAAGYLLGAIPSAIWICRGFFRVDITSRGSGNPGMTNVWRALGWKPALPVALLDATKGVLAAWLGAALTHSPTWALLAGVAAVLGHSFSFLARFKGGKGVLTGFGVFLYLSPWASLASLTLWVLVMFLTRFVSLSSMAAALTLPVFIFIEVRKHGGEGTTPVFWAALGVCVFVMVRHRANFARLLNGTESRFQGKAS
jgi:glycerol-3-phosphate acyltransferase PlsY